MGTYFNVSSFLDRNIQGNITRSSLKFEEKYISFVLLASLSGGRGESVSSSYLYLAHCTERVRNYFSLSLFLRGFGLPPFFPGLIFSQLLFLLTLQIIKPEYLIKVRK